MPDTKLFQPIAIGPLRLAHRVVMAPLTRFRCDAAERVPLHMVKEHYVQRACTPGTLIIGEGTHISPDHLGYPHAPGLWSAEQVAAWKDIVAAVHAKGCFMYCQLWAPGRIALDPYPCLAPSPIPAEEGGRVPREMTDGEIRECIKQFAEAAKRAVHEAGFDGVELHGGNGYLIDEFIQDVSNHRTDEWGGSVENRGRFAIELVKAVADAVGPERTAIRFSPWSTFQGMKMASADDALAQFGYIVGELRKLKIAYLHLIESRVVNSADVEKVEGLEPLLEIWDNVSSVLVAGGNKPETAREIVDEEYAKWDVCLVFGRYFISTPDLVFRLREGIAPNPYDRATFYAALESKGYIDYPFSKEFEALKG